MVLGGFRWLLVVPCFSNYVVFVPVKERDIQVHELNLLWYLQEYCSLAVLYLIEMAMRVHISYLTINEFGFRIM